MNQVVIKSVSSPQVLWGESLSVKVMWSHDVPAYVAVVLYSPPNYNQISSYGFTPVRDVEENVWLEDVELPITNESDIEGVYQIWAILLDQSGNSISEWVGPVDISVIVQPPPSQAPQQAPVLVSPGVMETVKSNFPTFSWGEVPGASTYDLMVSGNGRTWINLTLIRGLFHQSASPLPNSADSNQYYIWKVRAVNQYGTGLWSEDRAFVISATTLSTPVLVAPTTGATLSGTPEFRWTSVGANKYSLQLSLYSDFRTVFSDNVVYGVSFSNYGFLREGTYYWRVRGQDSNGNWTQWSSVSILIIATTPVPGAPSQVILVSPAQNTGVKDRRPTFRWNAVAGTGLSYWLVVGVGGLDGFKTKYINMRITGTSYQPPEDLPLEIVITSLGKSIQ